MSDILYGVDGQERLDAEVYKELQDEQRTKTKRQHGLRQVA